MNDYYYLVKLKGDIFLYFHLVKNNCLYIWSVCFLSLFTIFVSISSFGYKSNSVVFEKISQPNSHCNWMVLTSLISSKFRSEYVTPAWSIRVPKLCEKWLEKERHVKNKSCFVSFFPEIQENIFSSLPFVQVAPCDWILGKPVQSAFPIFPLSFRAVETFKAWFKDGKTTRWKRAPWPTSVMAWATNSTFLC